MLIPGLDHEPVSLRARWESKTVATRSPVRGEHDEHWVTFDLESESPFVAALLLDDGEVSQFGRLPAGAQSSRLTVRLYFTPVDWHRSDAVNVGLYQSDDAGGAGISVRARDRALKTDPRPLADRQAADGEHRLGSVLRLGLVRLSHDIHASAVLVGRSDLAIVHDRWRLRRRDIELPDELSFLHTGQRKGTAPSRDGGDRRRRIVRSADEAVD